MCSNFQDKLSSHHILHIKKSDNVSASYCSKLEAAQPEMLDMPYTKENKAKPPVLGANCFHKRRTALSLNHRKNDSAPEAEHTIAADH